jgi:Fur family ferric uptake transcriptional regulator
MSNNQSELFIKTLKDSGNSLTSSRLKLFELLLNKEAQSINTLYKKGKGQFDRSSLYRSLELFEKLGIVQRVYYGWKFKLELTDKFSAHHHHLICSKCGKVIPIVEDKASEKAIENLSLKHGFKPLAHQLEIQGLCIDCLRAETKEPVMLS